MLIGLAYCQTPTPAESRFVGCYRITTLAWDPHGENVTLIPKGIELLNETKLGAFVVRSLPPKGERNKFETLWSWNPKGGNRIGITISTGLGGFRVTLRQASNSDLVGKLKEWCDYRCAYKRRIGTVHLRKMNCK